MTKEKKIDFPGYNLFQPLSFINSTIAVSSNIAYLAGGKKIFFPSYCGWKMGYATNGQEKGGSHFHISNGYRLSFYNIQNLLAVSSSHCDSKVQSDLDLGPYLALAQFNFFSHTLEFQNSLRVLTLTPPHTPSLPLFISQSHSTI